MSDADDLMRRLDDAEDMDDVLSVARRGIKKVRELESELAQLKQPAHVLAEAERLLRGVMTDGDTGLSLDLYMVPPRVMLKVWRGPELSQLGGETLVEVHALDAELRAEGGRDAG